MGMCTWTRKLRMGSNGGSLWTHSCLAPPQNSKGIFDQLPAHSVMTTQEDTVPWSKWHDTHFSTMRKGYTSAESSGWSFLHHNNIRLPSTWPCNAGVLSWDMYCLDRFWGVFGNEGGRTCWANMGWWRGKAWSWCAIDCHYSRSGTCEQETFHVHMLLSSLIQIWNWGLSLIFT
jgi:hypothetical protein